MEEKEKSRKKKGKKESQELGKIVFVFHKFGRPTVNLKAFIFLQECQTIGGSTVMLHV